MKKVYFLDKGHLYMFERRGARARSAERAKILEEGIGSERGMRGFQGGASGKEPACQCRRHKRCRFDSWVRKIPWRRAWQPMEDPMDRGAWGAMVHRIAKSWT